MKDTRAKTFASVVATNWVGWLFGRAAGAVTLAVLARAFGSEGLGQVIGALAASLLVSALTVGSLPDVLARDISSMGGAVSLRHVLTASSGALGRSVLLAVGVASVLLWQRSIGTGVAVGLVALAGLQSANLVLSAIPRARNQSLKYIAVSGNLSSVLRLGVAILGIMMGMGPSTHLAGFAMVEALVSVLAVGSSRPWSRSATMRAPGAREGIAGVVWPVLSNADVLVLQLVAGSAAAGQYGPVMRLGEFTTQAALAIAAPYLPAATRLVAHGRVADAAALYRLSAKVAVTVTLPVVCVLFVEAEMFLRLFLGNSATPGQVLVLRILLVGYLLHVTAGQNFGTLISLQKQGSLTWTSLLFSLAYVSALAWATTVGIVATAIITALAYVVGNLTWSSMLLLTSGRFADAPALVVSLVGIAACWGTAAVGPGTISQSVVLVFGIGLLLVVPFLLLPVVKTLRKP